MSLFFIDENGDAFYVRYNKNMASKVMAILLCTYTILPYAHYYIVIHYFCLFYIFQKIRSNGTKVCLRFPAFFSLTLGFFMPESLLQSTRTDSLISHHHHQSNCQLCWRHPYVFYGNSECLVQQAVHHNLFFRSQMFPWSILWLRSRYLYGLI